MSAQLNHTIVWCRDPVKSARFLADLLGLAPPVHFSRFLVVELANGVSLDYAEKSGDIARQHYAFLISEVEFDRVFARLEEKNATYWADPGQHQTGEINRRDGGRGVYFEDPDGHLLEVLTRPYGSGSA